MSVLRAMAMVVAVLTTLGLSGCGTTVPGKALPGLDPASVGGLPVTEGASGPKDGVPTAQLPVTGGDGGEIDALAVNAVADVQQFWTAAFPADFGTRFSPVRQLVSFDSEGGGGQVCGTSTAGLVNAFYCPQQDTIAWDRGQLLPSLAEQYGPMSVVLVLAHEIGHAVQARLDLVDQNTATIVAEQQADCFAGSFMRQVAEGRAEHFQLSTGDGLNKVLAAIVLLRDQVGSELTEEDAHGSAFDRVAAFQFGFTYGNQRCARIDLDEVTSRATQLGFDPDDRRQGNLPITEATVEKIMETLRETFGDNQFDQPRLRFDSASCGSSEPSPPASYCPNSNVIAIDIEGLSAIGTPRGRRDQIAAVGDFAAFGLVASRYALAVQRGVGLGLTGDRVGLRTACLVGAWAGLHIDNPFGGRRPLGSLKLAPGDLDEAVASLLGDGLIASDAAGDTVPSGFARVEAFRIGFLQGADPCTARFR